MAADPRQDPRAHDLLSADPGVVSALASTFRTVAEQAQGAADGLRGAEGDATWTGAAASAFRAGVGKLPGDLAKVTSSYQEAGDALTAYEGELSALQPAFRAIVSELGSADSQLASAQSSLGSAQSALGAAQAKLTASAMAHPLAPLQSVPANSPLISAVGAASSAVNTAQGNIDALSTRGFHILDEFDSARHAAKGKVDSASQVPPQPGFWDSLFHDVGNFLGGALHFVEGIGVGIWNSVTGTVSAFENFVNHPSLATFGKLASDVTVDAGIVMLAAAAPEALGLVGGAEALTEGGTVALEDGAVAAEDGAGAGGVEPPPAGDGPVIFKAPPGATPEEIAQIKAYVQGCNDARDAGQLSPTGRVSTTGELRAQASRSAAAERAAAVDRGTPYVGQAGHVPDTTWTGNPDPYAWLDLSPRVNASLGGQAVHYPVGFQPTGFFYGP